MTLFFFIIFFEISSKLSTSTTKDSLPLINLGIINLIKNLIKLIIKNKIYYSLL